MRLKFFICCRTIILNLLATNPTRILGQVQAEAVQQHVSKSLNFRIQEFPNWYASTNSSTNSNSQPIIFAPGASQSLTLICTCVGSPIEMVHNYDLDLLTKTYFPGVDQFIHRSSSDFWNPASYIYKAHIKMKVKGFIKLGSVTCRLVDAPTAQELQKSLRINFATINDTSQVRISVVESDAGNNGVSTAEAASSNNDNNRQQCAFNFKVKETENGGELGCTYAENAQIPLTVQFAYCYSSADCKNVVRNLQQFRDICVQRVGRNETCQECRDPIKQVGHDKRFHPQIIICSNANAQQALPFFYSFAPDGKSEHHKLHVFWSEVTGQDMLFLDPLPKKEYALNETLEVTCHGIQYYFSFGYRIGIEINGSLRVIPEGGPYKRESTTNARIAKQSILLNETGQATIYCFGPVINSSEWVNKSAQIRVALPATNSADADVGTTTATAEFNDELNNGPKTDTQLPFIIGGLLAGMAVLVAVIVLIFTRRLRLVERRIHSLCEEDIKQFREGRTRVAVAPPITASPRDLDDENGRPSSANSYISMSANESPIEYLPYNSHYEVPRNQIMIEDKLLGSGTYGIVKKGTVLQGSTLVPVAVKTIKPGCDLCYFKALLSELKIMAYLDNGHANIVGLVAAYTENIKNRELFIGIELCKMSLLEGLRSKSSTFVNLVKHGALVANSEVELSTSTSYENVSNAHGRMTTKDLVRWSHQIADGMDFLCSKKVIHGDLAARNILLTEANVVKICDFGLARQLVDYNYIKSEQCPLPWKWMAIESLSEMKFSAASDVWSLGVVLWEIFSLGQIPYPGLSWTPDFVKQLSAGLRMTIPEFCTNDIYQLMLSAWEVEPKDRPKFEHFKRYFENLLLTVDDDDDDPPRFGHESIISESSC